MTRTWQDVWAGRQLDPGGGSTLAQLLAADRLDEVGRVTEDAWRGFIHRTAAQLGITPGTSVFDVGCGAGAFVYELRHAGCSVGGVDASEALVACARQAMPDGRFATCDAAALPFDDRWDVVVSCGAFSDFPSHEYARQVVARMVKKAARAVAILDVPDLTTRDGAIVMWRDRLGAAEHDARYRGLDHLYYERGWFERVLGGLGVRTVRIEGQSIEGYAQAAYRFNVLALGMR